MTNLPNDPSLFADEGREREVYSEAMAELRALQPRTCTAVRQIVGRAWQTLWDEGIFGHAGSLATASVAFTAFLDDVFKLGTPPAHLTPEGFADLPNDFGEVIVYASAEEIVALTSQWADCELRSDSQWRVQSLEEYREEYRRDEEAA